MTDLPSGWTTAPLGELVDVLDSRRIPVSGTERAKRTGTVPYYGATGRVGYIDTAIFNEDLVLLGEDGVAFFDLGKPKAYLISGPSWVNNHAHVLRVDDRFLRRRYLLHYLNWFDYHGHVTGTTRLKLTKSAMNAIPVHFPSVAEQGRIAALLENLLSHLDTAEEVLFAAVEKVERHRNRFVAAACRGGLVPAVEGSVSRIADASVQDGNLPLLPKDWRWVRLGEIADVVGGITKDAKRQADTALPEVPYLRVANVQRGHLNLDQVATIRAPAGTVQRLSLRSGDVLLNEGGDRDKLGRGWIWEDQISQCIHQNHVFRARIHGGKLEPKLLAWHANTFGKGWCERNGKQSVNLASISLSKIRLLPIPVPPPNEQTALVDMIEGHLAELDRLNSALQQARQRSGCLRRSLLVEAFAGRLVAQDPNDEPASVLLERIRAERVALPKVRRGRRSPMRPDEQVILL